MHNQPTEIGRFLSADSDRSINWWSNFKHVYDRQSADSKENWPTIMESLPMITKCLYTHTPIVEESAVESADSTANSAANPLRIGLWVRALRIFEPKIQRCDTGDSLSRSLPLCLPPLLRSLPTSPHLFSRPFPDPSLEVGQYRSVWTKPIPLFTGFKTSH